MPFVPATLQASLLATFNSMKDGQSITFAQGIATAVVTFVSTGLVTTTDVGAVSGGAFVGSGTGTITVTPTDCLNTIKNACDKMKDMTSGGDDYLAQEIGKGLKQMADNGKVITTVVGTMTTPAGVPTPMAGSANGSIKCVETALVQNLKLLFKEMYNKKDDDSYNGNMEFAKKLASEINTFWTTGIVSTDGSANLSGSKGTGTVA